MTRLLYIGPLAVGSTSLDRVNTLRDLGLDVVALDTLLATGRFSRPWQSLAGRAAFGPPVTALNRAILEAIQRIDGVSQVWVDKGVWVYPDTIAAMQSRLRAPIIHFTPDPAITYHRSRHFFRSLPMYDACITTKVFEVDMYREAGARRVILSHQAYERTRFFPRSVTPEYASDVTLIGHCEPHYARCAAAALQVTDRVRLWGQSWGPRLWRYPQLRRCFQGGPIYGEGYCKALCSAKICLGVLSKLITETSTTRTFEIPASGIMMLAERTDEHLSFFTEDREAVFFSSPDELKDKLRYYLTHDGCREAIATAGRVRCKRTGYSNHDRLAGILAALGVKVPVPAEAVS